MSNTDDFKKTDSDDFDKSDREGISAFRKAMSSATKELMEHRSQLVDKLLLDLSERITELHAEGEIETDIGIEWPVQSRRFRQQVITDLTALLEEEGLKSRNMEAHAYDDFIRIHIWFDDV